MEQSRTFINVTPCRAKVRHQQTRRKTVPLVRGKKEEKKKKSSTLVQLPKVSKEQQPTPSSLSGDDVDEEFGVEEVVRSDPTPTFLAKVSNNGHGGIVARRDSEPSNLYSQKDVEKATIHDFFPAFGNLEMPYYFNTYQSRPSSVPQVLNYCLSASATFSHYADL
jgi:hypothetical protein